MNHNLQTKSELRKVIAESKKSHTTEQLRAYSARLFAHLEKAQAVQQARTLLLYHSIGGEVYTHDVVKRWAEYKRILLPVVVGNDLELRSYRGESNMAMSQSFRIMEPVGEAFTRFEEIDLCIIPGVAFDVHGNRLGRGKGYYDRLLTHIRAPKVGVCYGFQVVDVVPTDPHDQPMDEVWSEMGRVYPY